MNEVTPTDVSNEPRGLPEPERAFVVSLICVLLFAGIIGTTTALINAVRGRHAAEAEIAVQTRIAADAIRLAQERAESALFQEPKINLKPIVEKLLAEQLKVDAENRLAAFRRSHSTIAELLTELDEPTLDRAGVNRIAQGLNAAAIPDDADLAQAQLIIGNRLSHLGYSTEATLMLRKSLESREKLFGSDDTQTLTTLNAFALAYERAGSVLPDGPDLLAAARKTQTARHGPNHPLTLATTSRLAYVLRRNNRFVEAIPLYENLLDHQRKNLKADDWRLADPIGTLAEVYRAAGMHKETVPLLKESLDLHHAKFEREDPRVLDAMTKLATAYRQLGDWQAVVPILENSLKIRRESIGNDHPDTQTNLAALAGAYRAAGEFDSAVPLFEQRLEHLKAALGPNHTRTRAGLTSLAFVLIEAKQMERAGVLLKEITAAARKDSFAGKRGYAETLTIMGAELIQIGAYDNAEPMLSECLQIREKTDPNGWGRAEAEFVLGVCLLGMKKPADAEPMLQSGFDDLKKRKKAIPPEANARLVRMIDVAVRLYEARGNTVAAERWRRERDGFKRIHSAKS